MNVIMTLSKAKVTVTVKRGMKKEISHILPFSSGPLVPFRKAALTAANSLSFFSIKYLIDLVLTESSFVLVLQYILKLYIFVAILLIYMFMQKVLTSQGTLLQRLMHPETLPLFYMVPYI